MDCLIVGIVCLIIGWLDPIVLWRKATGLAEKNFFPKAEAWRNEWRGNVPNIPEVPPIPKDKDPEETK